MAIHMATTIREERVRWVLPIIRSEVRITDVVKVCPHSQRSLERWVSAYHKHGAEGLEPKSTRPKTHPQETPICLKEKVIALRKQKKVCALKLKWKLAKQGLYLHERTIGKILKAEGLVKKYRIKKVTYKYIKASLQPGELVEMDVKYVPGSVAGHQYFQYTAIDCASRWRYLRVFDAQATYHSVQFLKEVLARFKYKIRAIKTDNHSTFTNRYNGTYKRSDFSNANQHALDQFCAAQGITHYLIDPGKPAQNGKVERSHREDQEKLYDAHMFRTLVALRKGMRKWNTEYNNLEHCGLEGKTPNEFLTDYQLISPPNVRT